MPIEVRLPELAESMSSATLTAWLKEVGDQVAEGEPIAEVETDKTTVELEAPASGVIEAIQVSAGTADVAVGEVLAVLRERSPADASSVADRPTPRPTPGDRSTTASASAAPPEPAPDSESPSPDAPSPDAPSPGALTPALPVGPMAVAAPAAADAAAPRAGAPPASQPSAAGPSAAGPSAAGPSAAGPSAAGPSAAGPAAAEVAATPLARRMAALAGLDLAAVAGIAAGGRVGKADVERALGGKAPAATAAGVAAGALRAEAPGPAPLPVGPPPTLPVLPHRDEPLTAARRVTAARMTQAKQTAPHFYLEVDCSVDRLVERLRSARAASGATGEADATPTTPSAGAAPTTPSAAGAGGAAAAGVTLTDLVVRAAALALEKVPLANSAWTGDAVRVFETADIAVAVATPAGLVTPVVRDAGGKRLATLAAELRDLTVRARDGRLQPSEYAGGTFTISNLGMYGVSRLYAILNPPQSCILGVGAIESRPIVRDGEVVAGRTMAVTLSADHRALDGATGAAFLRELRELIEHPDAIFD